MNFAQGDLMMVGAASTVWLMLKGGFPYQAALIVAVTAMFGLGYAIDALVVRRLIGKPRFSIVMLTFGIGAVMRSLAGLAWGYEPLSFPSPYGGKALHIGSAMVSADNVAIIAGTVALCIALYFFFRYTPLACAYRPPRRTSWPPAALASTCGEPIRWFGGLRQPLLVSPAYL